LTDAGPALGILADADFTGQELTLTPGAALLLYTDGLTDRHGDPEAPATKRLAWVIARAFGRLTGDRRHRPTAQHLAETVVQDMLDGAAPDDDVCAAVLWTSDSLLVTHEPVLMSRSAPPEASGPPRAAGR
jgi:serine phosphatase RsbU (regulator of sigma subunit)